LYNSGIMNNLIPSSEQAEWLGSPRPWFLESLKKHITIRVGKLFDGGFLWFIDESILISQQHDRGNLKFVEVKEMHPSKGNIIACNPGAKTVSRFLPLYLEGGSLAVTMWTWYEKITHIEAWNDELVREVQYEEVFRYLGDNYTAQIFQMMAQLNQDLLTEGSQKRAYQVTPKWVEQGLLLVSQDKTNSRNGLIPNNKWGLRQQTYAQI